MTISTQGVHLLREVCSRPAVDEIRSLQALSLTGNGLTLPVKGVDQLVAYYRRPFTRKTMMIQSIDHV